MTYRSILLAGLTLLAGCAHRGELELPVCDGSTRRAANPHGSVLMPQAGTALSTPTEDADTGGCA